VTAPIRLADGRRFRYHEPIPVAGELRGKRRAAAFRAAKAEGWPLVGSAGSRAVVMTKWLDAQGIPFDIVTDDEAVE
jgi:hypothetical protein